jgi:hypothetical protein
MDLKTEETKKDASDAILRQLASVEAAFEKLDVPDLRRHLRSLLDEASRAGLVGGAGRFPLPLIAEPAELAGQSWHVEAPRVQVYATPEHLVLSPDTARAYELHDFKVGKNTQFIAPGPLPLDTFSVEYAKNERLSDLQRFRCDECPPGIDIHLVVALRHAAPRAPFRGLLWCGVREY